MSGMDSCAAGWAHGEVDVENNTLQCLAFKGDECSGELVAGWTGGLCSKQSHCGQPIREDSSESAKTQSVVHASARRSRQSCPHCSAPQLDHALPARTTHSILSSAHKFLAHLRTNTMSSPAANEDQTAPANKVMFRFCTEW